jgi:PPE-repeat protein
MDFGALPPEINSGRMYLGPGPATLLAASAGWKALATELHSAASGYQLVISSLIHESWSGPSSTSMVAAVTPYLIWMSTTAAQCDEAAGRAAAAASAHETAFAMTVPPPLIAANRVQLVTLIATNLFGQNTPAIMATEAEYGEMWAQDATAMYGYAASSASASAFSTFTAPPPTTDEGGLADRGGAIAQAAGTEAGNAQTTSAQLVSSVPQPLQGLSTPGSSSAMGATAGLAATGASAPTSALSSLAGSGKSVTKGASASLGAISNLVTSATSGLNAETAGLASDVAGFGSDGPVAGLDTATCAGFGDATSLGTLSVPPSWADALSVAAPMPVLDANVMPGGWGAGLAAAPGPAISKLPLGGMIGRESEGAVQRVGFRTSLIPRSPVAG